MTSFDWWAILQRDAQARGPQAVHLVATVGQARAMDIFNARVAKAYANFLDGRPPEPPGPTNLYDAMEPQLKKVLELRPGRLRFPSEGKIYPNDTK